jgi:hypothetical protein
VFQIKITMHCTTTNFTKKQSKEKGKNKIQLKQKRVAIENLISWTHQNRFS